jgi:hypothetical protein
MPATTPKLRLALYAGLNFSFLLVLTVADVVGGSSNPRWLYLALLFALCSTSVLDLDGLNGRYSLLGIFLLAYFIYFGVGNLTQMVFGKTTPDLSMGALSSTEAVILVGGVMLIFGYRTAVAIGASRSGRSPPRDWPASLTLLIGLTLWAIGTWATFNWYVHIVTDVTLEATRAGLAKLGPLLTVGYILAQMMQPLGVLLIAYVWRVSRGWHLSLLVASIVAIQVILGFIIDIKGIALLGWILVLATVALVDGRVAKMWLLAAVIFVVATFPIFQAYRQVTEGNRGIARTAVVANFEETLKRVLAQKERVTTGVNRAQNFVERVSLKGSVQTIVDKVGIDVPFQQGYTLIPITETFIPRILWSDKPDIPTGQIMNRVFHITEQDETYISPTHLGELYWNFGWPGVVIGMTLIGVLCGLVARYNLAQARTVTRLLISVLTIRYVINGFEGSLAASYVVWLRSLVAVAALHLIFARVRVPLRGSSDAADPEAQDAPLAGLNQVKAFPNLLS